MVKYKVLFNEKGFVNTTQERGGKNASDYRMNFLNTCDHCRVVVQFKRLLLEGRDSVNVVTSLLQLTEFRPCDDIHLRGNSCSAYT